jgi:hypothetical protein
MDFMHILIKNKKFNLARILFVLAISLGLFVLVLVDIDLKKLTLAGLSGRILLAGTVSYLLGLTIIGGEGKRNVPVFGGLMPQMNVTKKYVMPLVWFFLLFSILGLIGMFSGI